MIRAEVWGGMRDVADASMRRAYHPLPADIYEDVCDRRALCDQYKTCCSQRSVTLPSSSSIWNESANDELPEEGPSVSPVLVADGAEGK